MKGDLTVNSPRQCNALGCLAGRAVGAGSGHGTGEEGAGSVPQQVPSWWLPGGLREGISPQNVGWALLLYHQLVSRQGEQPGAARGAPGVP